MKESYKDYLSEMYLQSEKLMHELSVNFTKDGYSYRHLWSIGSGVKNRGDAKKIRNIAKKYGFKAQLCTSFNLSIHFVYNKKYSEI